MHLEGTLIITDLKRSSLGRTEISEYTPPPNALVTALCPFSFLRSERLSRRLVLCKKCTIHFNTIKQVNANSDLNTLKGFISLLIKRTPKNIAKIFFPPKYSK